MKGLCTKFGFAAMCQWCVYEYVCSCMLLSFCCWPHFDGVCVCVASVVSIPVRSWLEESKSNRASHSDLRPRNRREHSQVISTTFMKRMVLECGLITPQQEDEMALLSSL